MVSELLQLLEVSAKPLLQLEGSEPLPQEGSERPPPLLVLVLRLLQEGSGLHLLLEDSAKLLLLPVASVRRLLVALVLQPLVVLERRLPPPEDSGRRLLVVLAPLRLVDLELPREGSAQPHNNRNKWGLASEALAQLPSRGQWQAVASEPLLVSRCSPPSHP